MHHRRTGATCSLLSRVHSYNANQAVEIPQPVDLTSRVNVAASFAERYGLSEIRLFVDSPEDHSINHSLPSGPEEEARIIKGNSFERNFAAWPLRFYVIVNGIIVSGICSQQSCVCSTLI
jgi:hypothetical protein